MPYGFTYDYSYKMRRKVVKTFLTSFGGTTVPFDNISLVENTALANIVDTDLVASDMTITTAGFGGINTSGGGTTGADSGFLLDKQYNASLYALAAVTPTITITNPLIGSYSIRVGGVRGGITEARTTTITLDAVPKSYDTSTAAGAHLYTDGVVFTYECTSRATPIVLNVSSATVYSYVSGLDIIHTI